MCVFVCVCMSMNVCNMCMSVSECEFSSPVAAGDVNQITLTIVCTPNMLPSLTSAAIVTVMYTICQQQQCGHPAITQHIITLPLSLFCRPVTPAKNAEHKVRSCDAAAVNIVPC